MQNFNGETYCKSDTWKHPRHGKIALRWTLARQVVRTQVAQCCDLVWRRESHARNVMHVHWQRSALLRSGLQSRVCSYPLVTASPAYPRANLQIECHLVTFLFFFILLFCHTKLSIEAGSAIGQVKTREGGGRNAVQRVQVFRAVLLILRNRELFTVRQLRARCIFGFRRTHV
jgi:hypothetical protein